MSLPEADRRGFDAALALVDEYDADVDLADDPESNASLNTSAGVHAVDAWAQERQLVTSSSDCSRSDTGAETNADELLQALLAPPPASPSQQRCPSKLIAPRSTGTGGRAMSSASSSSSSPVASVTSNGDTSGPTPTPTYPSQTRRQELVYLRKKMATLEEQLRVLKQSKYGPTTSPAEAVETKAPVTSRLVDRATAAMWEDVVLHQFEQRQQAEVENLRLRSLLESQIKLGRGLERLLKRTNVDLFLPTNHAKRMRYTGTMAPSEDAAAFAELLGIVDEMYRELDDVIFADDRFAHDEHTVQDVEMVEDTSLGPVVDVYDARNLPFAVRDTADAMWSYFTQVSRHEREASAPLIDETDDEIKRHFSFPVKMQHFTAVFRGRLAARRYFEGNGRIVILWVAMIEPEMLSGTSEGLVVRQRGATIVRPPRHVATNVGTASARLQSKFQAIPYVYDDVPDRKRKTGTLTNFVLQSVYSHLQTNQRMMENVLLLGARGK